MKNRILIYSFLPALGLIFATATTASALSVGAFGNLAPADLASRVSGMFQKEATALGISLDAVKSGWAQGKSLQEIASANGITEEQLKQKLDAARQADVKTQLQTLVSQGVITQAQADARLSALQAKAGEMKGRGHGPRGRGFGFLGI